MNKIYRTRPLTVVLNKKIARREVVTLEIKSSSPGSSRIFISDIEWVPQNNVPVSLVKKETIYGEHGIEGMRICLFNNSNYEDALVNVYKIEEHHLDQFTEEYNPEQLIKVENEEINADPPFFPDVINGVTLYGQDIKDIRLGVGTNHGKQLKDFMYSYDDASYPRTVVVTEVDKITDTDWKIVFYNANPDKTLYANITVRAIFRTQHWY